MAGIEVKSFAQPDEFREPPRFIKEEAVVGGAHVATRVAGLAQAGEVLVSQSAVALLDGSDIPLEDAGEHELKGVSGRRRLYPLMQ